MVDEAIEVHAHASHMIRTDVFTDKQEGNSSKIQTKLPDLEECF